MALISERLADFTSASRFHEIPIPVKVRREAPAARRDRLRLCGPQERSSPCASPARWRSWRAPGHARVVGMAHRLPLRDAAIVNGMLMHGLDYDDTHAAGVIHLTVSTFPGGARTAGAARRLGRRAAYRLRRGRRSRRPHRERGRRAACTRWAFTRPAWWAPSLRAWSPAACCASRPARLAGAQGIALSLASGNLAVHRGRLVDEAHPPGLERAHAASPPPRSPPTTFRRHAKPTKGASASIAAICRRTCSRNPTCPWRPPALDSTWEIDNVAVKPFPRVPLRARLRRCGDRAASRRRRPAARALNPRIGARRRGQRRSASRSPRSAGRRTTTTPSSACPTRWRAAWRAAASASPSLLPAAFTEPLHARS